MGLCSASGARLLLATLALSTAYERCGDISNNCYKWSLEGRCEDPSDWAQHGCPLSCGKCKAHLCSARGAHEDYCTVEVDVPDPESGGMHCTIWHKLPGRGPLAVYWVSADGKQLPVGEIFFDKGLGLSTFQDHVFQLRDAGTQEVIAAVRMFPGRIVLTIDEAFLAAIASCDNIPHDTWTGSCDGEAASGGCVTNPGFMTVFCSRSCHACHLRQTEQRCTRRFLDMDQHPALRPGDMNQMFRDIVSRAKKYSYNITVLSKSPWIVTFDNFVSEAEIADMLSNVKEFQRSSDQGEYDEFGLMKARLDTMTKASRQKLFGPARSGLMPSSRVGGEFGTPACKLVCVCVCVCGGVFFDFPSQNREYTINPSHARVTGHHIFKENLEDSLVFRHLQSVSKLPRCEGENLCQIQCAR
ncbi:unnamed protein product [Effrenium voratum]|nr:unnamed protein product [Effrenium voratum]